MPLSNCENVENRPRLRDCQDPGPSRKSTRWRNHTSILKCQNLAWKSHFNMNWKPKGHTILLVKLFIFLLKSAFFPMTFEFQTFSKTWIPAPILKSRKHGQRGNKSLFLPFSELSWSHTWIWPTTYASFLNKSSETVCGIPTFNMTTKQRTDRGGKKNDKWIGEIFVFVLHSWK